MVADAAMRELVLLPLPEEPRILDDAVDTWTVESWRSMSKKEHGPVFQAGGYPWYVSPPPRLLSLTYHAPTYPKRHSSLTGPAPL